MDLGEKSESVLDALATIRQRLRSSRIVLTPTVTLDVADFWTYHPILPFLAANQLSQGETAQYLPCPFPDLLFGDDPH